MAMRSCASFESLTDKLPNSLLQPELKGIGSSLKQTEEAIFGKFWKFELKLSLKLATDFQFLGKPVQHNMNQELTNFSHFNKTPAKGKYNKMKALKQRNFSRTTK